MAKKVKKEKVVTVNKVNPEGCGSVPTRPGSKNPGDWVCRDGQWVWVENIGG